MLLIHPRSLFCRHVFDSCNLFCLHLTQTWPPSFNPDTHEPHYRFYPLFLLNSNLEPLPFVWKPENSGENSNRTVHPGGNFPEKSNTFRGITFFPFLPKRPKFSVPFVWVTSARLHVERRWKIYRYFVNGTTQSRSCFRCPKKTPVPFDRNLSPKLPYKW